MAPRLAIDATPLLGTRTGVGQVTAGILEALAARHAYDLVAYALTWRGRAALEGQLPPGVQPATRPLPARAVRVAWRHGVGPHIERWTGPVDVVHATNFVAPPADAPVVVSVHDLTCVRFPALCTRDTLAYPELLRRAVGRGATVHVFSDFVGAEVATELDTERVVRVYPGLAVERSGDAARGRRLAGAARYVLAIGTLEPRKNLPLLVEAFDRLARRDAEVHLVVAGPDGWDRDAFTHAVERARHGDRVHRLGYVDAAVREDLLAGASVFAYPSLYEGFGHPPLEAMAAGVPVVAARAGALPEVLGDAALLVDPLDAPALASAIEAALDDDVLRAALCERGHARVGRYTWDDCTDGLLALYDQVRG